MKINYLALDQQHKNLKVELLNAAARVLEHSMFINGEDVRRFEKNMEKYCQVKHVVAVNSGTDALFLSLKTLNLTTKDEIITVPNSFLATAASIIAAGGRPVFVDVNEDMNINPDLIEKSITKKTKAILPVHLTGKPADMKPIMEIAKKHDLNVIEDAAQAIGAEYHGKKVGSIGDIGCFSLHPLKNLNACGDAGFITCSDQSVFEKLLLLRNHGLKNRDEAAIWGYNSRLDTIQAALLNVKLKYLDKWIEQRRKNAFFYNQQLKELVKTPEEKKDEKSVYHTYIIQTDKRDDLKIFLLKNGIETKIHYPIPIHLQQASRHLGYKKGDFPVAEKQAEEILSLPVYPELTRNEINYIVTKINIFFKKVEDKESEN